MMLALGLLPHAAQVEAMHMVTLEERMLGPRYDCFGTGRCVPIRLSIGNPGNLVTFVTTKTHKAHVTHGPTSPFTAPRGSAQCERAAGP